MKRSLLYVGCLSLTTLLGCGGANQQVQSDVPPPPAPADASSKSAKAAPGHLARDDVESVLAQGPPWILRRVPVEEVIRGGNFIGWKLLSIPEDWTGIELRPFDVVMKVNGNKIELPEDFFRAWSNLVSASELRIEYERDGATKELVMPIDGPPSQHMLKAFASDAPPRRPATNVPKGTLVIEEDSGIVPQDE